MSKHFFISLILTIFVFTIIGCSQQQIPQKQLIQPTQTTSPKYVGSLQSNKYHYPSCQWAKKIKTTNEIWFANEAEAKVAGYVSCNVCKP